MQPLRVLSLFDGISVGKLALEKADIPLEVYFASEIDKRAIKISKHNNPDIKHLGDIRHLDLASLGPIDLVLGGPPCQSFSKVGHSFNEIGTRTMVKGFDDPRGQLFWDYVRLLEILQPNYFLTENVIMSPDHRNVISNALGTRPILLDSSYFTAQSRPRYFWTNLKLAPIQDSNLYLDSVIDWTATNRRGLYKSELDWVLGRSNWIAKPLIVTPENCSTIKSRAVLCKSTAYFIPFIVKTSDGYFKPTEEELEKLQGLPLGYTRNPDHNPNDRRGAGYMAREKMIGNAWTVPVIAHLLKGLHRAPKQDLTASSTQYIQNTIHDDATNKTFN